MTPESLLGAFALADRFALILRTLTGQPLPPPPDLPGRRILATDAPLSEEDLRTVTSPTELALVLGISKQASQQRIARCEPAADTEGGSHD